MRVEDIGNASVGLGHPSGAAIAVSALAHPGPDCADACVLCCSGIPTAVPHGTFDDIRLGLDLPRGGHRENHLT
ncbi:hypothetical protein ACH5AL_20365 [Actinacidiphila glaucinigra]|uniref:hypothetical protein n=1 Tax=Actinacidiphila glaucinigra TaxID=235986 RepID=UPI00379E287A